MIVFFVLSFAGVLHFEHADVVYPEGYFDVAVLVGNIFETIRKPIVEMIGNDPGRINIVLQEKGTVSNGYTNPLFHRTIVLYVWPPESWIHFYLPLEDWYTYLLIHEFTHMCHLTYQDVLSRIITVLTGIPFYPQLNSQYIEGPTVFAESNFSLASGRLNNPFMSNALYYYSLPNFPSFTYKEIMPEDDYRGGLLYYNFTAGFYKYLVETYGPDKMRKFFELTTQLASLQAILNVELKDPYEEVFGKKFSELYTDWIMSLTKLRYRNDKLVYKQDNASFMKVDYVGKPETDGKLALMVESFGPVTSYLGVTFNEVVFVDPRSGKSTGSKPISAIDLKFDGNTRYALVKSVQLGRVENQVWDLTKNRLLARGDISAFAVKTGKVYYAVFDTKKLKTLIKERVDSPESIFEYNGYVRYMECAGEFLVLLTLDNKIIFVDPEKRSEVARIDDPNMKGPYVKAWKDGVLFSRVEGDYVIPYYFDLNERKFYRLATDTVLMDFTIVGEDMYYVSYVPYGPTGGMGVYTTKVLMEPYEELPSTVKSYRFDITEKPFNKGNELQFRLAKFITPVTWAPMYLPQFFEDEESALHTLFVIFTFTNVESDTFFVLTPIFDFLQPNTSEFSFQFAGYRQFVGFITYKDWWGFSGSYLYPSNDYSLQLALELPSVQIGYLTKLYPILTASFKSSEEYNLDTVFSLVGNFQLPAVYSKNVGFGLGLRSNVFGKPVSASVFLLTSADDYTKLFGMDSYFVSGNFLTALNTNVSFAGLFELNLKDASKVFYDASLAFTLFKDRAELFGGGVLIKNSGLTVGLANFGMKESEELIDGFYSHFFVEMYLQGLKLYPSLGVLLPMKQLEGTNGFIYLGINTSPHTLPPTLFMGGF
ncbi:hypothetical protein [Fervidobacterium thailandense]|uniref:Biopolymer transporter Tol n=1 Tax=Fervidobacterium thailandense TaxID=1008305 RepID=A0A1E3G351_9BACT|nr:hypothetical protein [Fervidobacterium thailandense]ODN30726.1 hypothetical protein A4H02_04145 [Fervidobacterium thailandense]